MQYYQGAKSVKTKFTVKMAKYNRQRSPEFREMLATEYLSTNISIKELSEKYHTDAAYQLQKHGIKLKGI